MKCGKYMGLQQVPHTELLYATHQLVTHDHAGANIAVARPRTLFGPSKVSAMSPELPRQVNCPRCGGLAQVYPTLPTHVHCIICGLVEIGGEPLQQVA